MQEGGFQAGFQGRSNKKPNAKVKKKWLLFFFLFLFFMFYIKYSVFICFLLSIHPCSSSKGSHLFSFFYVYIVF